MEPEECLLLKQLVKAVENIGSTLICLNATVGQLLSRKEHRDVATTTCIKCEEQMSLSASTRVECQTLVSPLPSAVQVKNEFVETENTSHVNEDKIQNLPETSAPRVRVSSDPHLDAAKSICINSEEPSELTPSVSTLMKRQTIVSPLPLSVGQVKDAFVQTENTSPINDDKIQNIPETSAPRVNVSSDPRPDVAEEISLSAASIDKEVSAEEEGCALHLQEYMVTNERPETQFSETEGIQDTDAGNEDRSSLRYSLRSSKTNHKGTASLAEKFTRVGKTSPPTAMNKAPCNDGSCKDSSYVSHEVGHQNDQSISDSVGSGRQLSASLVPVPREVKASAEKTHSKSKCSKTLKTPSDSTAQQPFKCPKCSKVILRKNNFQRHMLLHSGIKTFHCDQCTASFLRKDHLVSHQLTHSGLRPFTCELCDKNFRDKTHLSVHISTHTGDRPYKCVNCGKAFSQKAHLKSHLNIHTGDRPYKCDHCEKGFLLKGRLKSHLKIHTRE